MKLPHNKPDLTQSRYPFPRADEYENAKIDKYQGNEIDAKKRYGNEKTVVSFFRKNDEANPSA